MADLMYTLEQLSGAVEHLAGGKGDLRARMRDAYALRLEHIKISGATPGGAETRLGAILDRLNERWPDGLSEDELSSMARELVRTYGALSEEYGRANSD